MASPVRGITVTVVVLPAAVHLNYGNLAFKEDDALASLIPQNRMRSGLTPTRRASALTLIMGSAAAMA
jgi:hypothetical protein